MATASACHVRSVHWPAPRAAIFCAENFIVGVEAYGGLGSTETFGAGEQRHYLSPVVGWHVTPRTTIKASAGIGLTQASDHALLRVGVSYELPGVRR